eukprot:364383_1
MSLTMLSAHRKNLLIFGYTRAHYNIPVPVVLIQSFEKYYDDFMYGKHDECLKIEFPEPSYRISENMVESNKGNINIKMSFYLNTNYSWYKHYRNNKPYITSYSNGCMSLSFKAAESYLKSLPPNVIGYNLNYVICGNLFNKKITQTEYIAHRRNAYQMIRIKTNFTFPEFKKLNYKSIDLGYYFTISSVKYNKMKTYYNWTHEFNKNELKQLSKFEINANDVNNWNINAYSCHPNTSYGECLAVNIKPNQLPYNIKSLDVKYNLQFKCGTHTQKRSGTENIQFECTVYLDWYSAFRNRSKIELNLSIQIVKIYDINGDLISKNDWHRYGFVSK